MIGFLLGVGVGALLVIVTLSIWVLLSISRIEDLEP